MSMATMTNSWPTQTWMQSSVRLHPSCSTDFLSSNLELPSDPASHVRQAPLRSHLVAEFLNSNNTIEPNSVALTAVSEPLLLERSGTALPLPLPMNDLTFLSSPLFFPLAAAPHSIYRNAEVPLTSAGPIKFCRLSAPPSPSLIYASSTSLASIPTVMRNSTCGLGLNIDTLYFRSICSIRHASHRRAYGALAFTLVCVDTPFANFGLSVVISSTFMASFWIPPALSSCSVRSVQAIAQFALCKCKKIHLSSQSLPHKVSISSSSRTKHHVGRDIVSRFLLHVFRCFLWPDALHSGYIRLSIKYSKPSIHA